MLSVSANCCCCWRSLPPRNVSACMQQEEEPWPRSKESQVLVLGFSFLFQQVGDWDWVFSLTVLTCHLKCILSFQLDPLKSYETLVVDIFYFLKLTYVYSLCLKTYLINVFLKPRQLDSGKHSDLVLLTWRLETCSQLHRAWLQQLVKRLQPLVSQKVSQVTKKGGGGFSQCLWKNFGQQMFGVLICSAVKTLDQLCE